MNKKSLVLMDTHVNLGADAIVNCFLVILFLYMCMSVGVSGENYLSHITDLRNVFRLHFCFNNTN